MSAASQETLGLVLPPSRVVCEFEAGLDPGLPRTVLDAGCGSGRNALYLARGGHQVVGVDGNFEDLQAAQSALAGLGDIAGTCHFANGDVRALPLRRSFDVVLSNEVLHLMSKTESRQAVVGMHALTKQGGVNVVSGYVVRPGTATTRNVARCLGPGELRTLYDRSGWTVLQYDEAYKPNQYIGPERREIISSIARIVAQRNWQ